MGGLRNAKNTFKAWGGGGIMDRCNKDVLKGRKKKGNFVIKPSSPRTSVKHDGMGGVLAQLPVRPAYLFIENTFLSSE